MRVGIYPPGLLNRSHVTDTTLSLMQPDTTQLVPTPGSALAVHYQVMSSLATPGGADSVDGRFHPYASALNLLHSPSDLEKYGRIDATHREPVYGNGFLDVYSMPYNMQSRVSSTMTEYYGPLSGNRSWSSVPAATAMTDLERTPSTIFYSQTANPVFEML